MISYLKSLSESIKIVFFQNITELLFYSWSWGILLRGVIFHLTTTTFLLSDAKVGISATATDYFPMDCKLF